MFTSNICVLAIDCGQPAVTPAYATMITSTNMSTTYQSNVTYQCDIGYWVANSVFTATTTCQADGTWSAVPDCSRKYANALTH